MAVLWGVRVSRPWGSYTTWGCYGREGLTLVQKLCVSVLCGVTVLLPWGLYIGVPIWREGLTALKYPYGVRVLQPWGRYIGVLTRREWITSVRALHWCVNLTISAWSYRFRVRVLLQCVKILGILQPHTISATNSDNNTPPYCGSVSKNICVWYICTGWPNKTFT